MRIEVKGHSLPVTDELRQCVEKRFDKVAKQVSDLALLEVELSEKHDSANPGGCSAEATLHLKGTTLRASDSSKDARHAINLVADEMSRQVKRHRDKRRKRREARAFAAQPPAPFTEGQAPPGSLPAV
jgi:putative sigma-54 modulation protein